MGCSVRAGRRRRSGAVERFVQGFDRRLFLSMRPARPSRDRPRRAGAAHFLSVASGQGRRQRKGGRRVPRPRVAAGGDGPRPERLSPRAVPALERRDERTGSQRDARSGQRAFGSKMRRSATEPKGQRAQDAPPLPTFLDQYHMLPFDLAVETVRQGSPVADFDQEGNGRFS